MISIRYFMLLDNYYMDFKYITKQERKQKPINVRTIAKLLQCFGSIGGW